MKVLVTGGTGLLGNNVLRRLLNEGHSVYSTWYQRSPDACEFFQHDALEWLQADLRIPHDCKNIVLWTDFDATIHCAASTSGAGTTASNPIAHVTPNVAMNMYMLEAAHEASVKKFIYPSSTTGYPWDETEGALPVIEDGYFEGEPFDKYFFMGHTKRFSERLCQMYSRLGMTTVILRPTNIFGPGDKFDPKTSHVLPALIRKVADKENPIEVWGDGMIERDFVYVDDVVDAIILALDYESSDAFNIGSGINHSIAWVLGFIQAIAKFVYGYEQSEVIFDHSKPSMIPRRRVDLSKAERVLGYHPETAIEEGIAKTFKWYLENKENIR